jgi:hypothetical protein
MEKKYPRYKKFPNHQRVKDMIFSSTYSWQNRISWMDRIIDWKGSRGENLEWQIILHNSKDKAESLQKSKIDRAKSDKNPWKNHSGKLSPFSDKFIGKTTKDEAIKNMKLTMSLNPSKQNTRIEYYLKQGMGLCLAISALKRRQATGAIDSYIRRYGVELGKNKWKERQIRWQETLRAKPEDEIARINAARLNNGYSISKAEKEIFANLSLKIPNLKRNITISYNNGKNWYVYDIGIDNKLIEYNGDYWHANPKIHTEEFYNKISKMSATDIWNKEKHKDSIAENRGYKILKVWEADYKIDPKRELEKCINFLTR